MELNFQQAQEQIDQWVKRHPDGYFPKDKLFEKLTEEAGEIKLALDEYLTTPTTENLQALEIEVGDELFALICITNVYGLDLERCFALMMEKNKQREQNNYQK